MTCTITLYGDECTYSIYETFAFLTRSWLEFSSLTEFLLYLNDYIFSFRKKYFLETQNIFWNQWSHGLILSLPCCIEELGYEKTVCHKTGSSQVHQGGAMQLNVHHKVKCIIKSSASGRGNAT